MENKIKVSLDSHSSVLMVHTVRSLYKMDSTSSPTYPACKDNWTDKLEII